jgi:drug/metabolite transporter (DMT)-like permease
MRMNANRIAAIVLIAAGILGLVYGGFNYTSETHQADIGSLHMSVDETKHINVPVWAGIGAIVTGGLLLGVGRKRG